MKKTLSRAQLSSHIENLKSHANTLPLNQLLNEQAISCVDGRNCTCVVAAPGGNAGLFLQMLATIELHTSHVFTPEQLSTLFSRYLDRFGHFYMHSDAHALEALRQAMKNQGTSISSIEELARLISAPTAPLKPVLLELLPRAAHTGCGHIRLMLDNPEAYRIRTELTTLFIKEFLTRFWDGDDRLQFAILEGDHAEQAILNIHIIEHEDLDNTPLVLLSPQLQDIQVFVNHPEAITYMHRQHAAFLQAQAYPGIEDYEAFFELHQEIHSAQLTATVQALGAGLPVFDVVLDEELNVQSIA